MLLPNVTEKSAGAGNVEVRRELAVCVFGDTALNIYIKIRPKEMSLMYTPSSTKYISRFRGQTLNSTLSRGRGFCKLAEHFGRRSHSLAVSQALLTVMPSSSVLLRVCVLTLETSLPFQGSHHLV